MIDDREIREMLHRRADAVPAAPADTPTAVRRARRRLVLNGTMASVAAVAIAVATLGAVDAIRTAPVPLDTPAPAPGVVRQDGEVLRFTGLLPDGNLGVPGDLVAVDPRTGEERVLLAGLDDVYAARWSADGRWLAYETEGSNGRGRDLWVVGGSQAPRIVATGGASMDLGYLDDGYLDGGYLDWKWSPTGADLATIEDTSTLRTIDVATGETTDLGTIIADLLSSASAPWPWAWSPDGAHLVVGSLDGSLYSVDVRSGERSLLARFPGTVQKVRVSPNGEHIAVQAGPLYLLNADGSNIRLVADDSNSLGFAWSPDGARLAFGSEAGSKVRIRVARIDGAAATEVGTVSRNHCAKTSWAYEKECLVTWSPDGTRVALRKENGEATVFDAAGAGEGEPLDGLTFLAWDGGWYRAPVW